MDSRDPALHSNRFRYYSPELGRYLNADPIGQAGDLHIYAYAAFNPAKLIDFWGDRPLSAAEREFLFNRFGTSLNLNNIDLDRSTIGVPNAIQPGNIRLPEEFFVGGDPCNDVDLLNPVIASIFAHEALHEWQRQNGISVFWSALGEHVGSWFRPGTAYDYSRPTGKDDAAKADALLDTFLQGGVEQQGQIWEDFVRDELLGLPTGHYRDVFDYIRGC